METILAFAAQVTQQASSLLMEYSNRSAWHLV